MKNKSQALIKSITILVFLISIILVAFFFSDFIIKYAGIGYVGVFLACFLSNASVLLPTPGLIIVMQYSLILSPMFTILVGALGGATGELIGYIGGKNAGNIIKINTDMFLFKLLKKFPTIMIVIFSCIPLVLFDIIGVLAGIIKINVIKFWLACFIGKTIQLSIIVLLLINFFDLINDLLTKFNIPNLF